MDFPEDVAKEPDWLLDNYAKLMIALSKKRIKLAFIVAAIGMEKLLEVL